MLAVKISSYISTELFVPTFIFAPFKKQIIMMIALGGVLLFTFRMHFIPVLVAVPVPCTVHCTTLDPHPDSSHNFHDYIPGIA